MTIPPDQQAHIRLHVGVLGFFFLLTLAVTWPLALHFSDRVPGWYVADNYEYLWKIWWFKHSIFDLRQSPLVAPHIFYPSGFALAHAELTPLHTLVGLPITWLWGEITTYNIFAMLSFILAGYATCLFVLRWQGDAWAGLLAGTLYILNPYHVVRYGGILPLMAVEGIPIFFLGLEGWLASRKLRWAAIAGLGFLVAAWASIYYAFGLLLLGPVYGLVRVKSLHLLLWDRKLWGGLALLILLVAFALVPLALPYLQLKQAIQLRIPLEDTDFWSASPTDYLLPAGLHPVWGTWVRSRLLSVHEGYPQIALEFVLGGGFLATLFAFYGWRKSRGGVQRALLWLTVTACILSFGPRLHIGRHPVILPAPEPVVSVFRSLMNSLGAWLPTHESYAPLADEGLTIPLPALLLRWILPPLNGMRAWNRFAAMASLGIALLAGLGFSAWMAAEIKPALKQAGRAQRAHIYAIAVLTLAIFELWPQAIPLQMVKPRPVDEWLAKQPGQFSLMEFPLTSALSAPQMLYTRYHGKRVAFGYGTYFPYWYREQYPELQNCPDSECLDRLKIWEVKYVLLNLDDKPNGPLLKVKFDQTNALRRIAQIGDIVIYEIIK